MLRIAAALAALALSGCRFAIVRFHGNAEAAPVKECFWALDNPNALECWDRFERRGAPVREL